MRVGGHGVLAIARDAVGGRHVLAGEAHGQQAGLGVERTRRGFGLWRAGAAGETLKRGLGDGAGKEVDEERLQQYPTHATL